MASIFVCCETGQPNLLWLVQLAPAISMDNKYRVLNYICYDDLLFAPSCLNTDKANVGFVVIKANADILLQTASRPELPFSNSKANVRNWLEAEVLI